MHTCLVPSHREYVNPATVHLNVGMYLPLGCPSHPWLENSFTLVSGWATNLRLSLSPAQPARLGPHRRLSPAGSGAGRRRTLGRFLPLGRGPNPAPGLRLRRPVGVFPLFFLRSLPSAHLPGSVRGRPGPSHQSRPLSSGRALHQARPAPHRLRSSQHLLSQTSAWKAPPNSPALFGPPFPRLSGEGEEHTFLPPRVRGVGRACGVRLRQRAAARLG